MFFLPRIFESIRDYLHLIGFSTNPADLGPLNQNYDEKRRSRGDCGVEKSAD